MSAEPEQAEIYDIHAYREQQYRLTRAMSDMLDQAHPCPIMQSAGRIRNEVRDLATPGVIAWVRTAACHTSGFTSLREVMEEVFDHLGIDAPSSPEFEVPPFHGEPEDEFQPEDIFERGLGSSMLRQGGETPDTLGEHYDIYTEIGEAEQWFRDKREAT